MANLLLDLVDFLAQEGLVKGDAIDAFRDFMPDSPDQVVSLYEYAGPPTTTGVMGIDRNIQISVRSDRDDPIWARSKAWEIFNLLDNPLDRILDLREFGNPKARWGVLWAKQQPFKVGVDKSGRPMYGFNMGISTSRD